MRKILFIFIMFCCGFVYSQKVSKNNDYYFYENKGQIIDQNGKENPNVKYLFLSNGLNVQLKKGGFSYDIYEVKKTVNPNSSKFKKDKSLDGKTYHKDEFLYENQFHRVDIVRQKFLTVEFIRVGY